MKKQIKRLSPHQNGKVFGVLMAVATLPMFIPMFLMMMAVSPNMDATGNPVSFPSYAMIIFPIFILFLAISL
ncbi:hypothetical protein RI845_03805 [Thalassotalea nanhaiensis]|uniref:ABC transporter permease n=1 Tax=Thalassotalea nanhaiensis TaxID=3065648 RepID=A0ABY9TKM3_9GAMM|nr:hypothetical protein RI845_03805 [Colwelliaceae bacterium SQ345]